MANGDIPSADIIDCPASPLVDCSQKNLANLFKSYFQPILREYEVVSVRSFDFESGYGDTVFELSSQRAGRHSLFQLGAVITPSGPKISLATLIDAVWKLRAGEEGVATKVGLLLKEKEYSLRFREELAEYGIGGKLLGGGRVMTWAAWDSWAEDSEARLRDEERRIAGSR
jgi:hypothetical protein